MTDEELMEAIRECEQTRARMIRQGLKETAEYQENNQREDGLLQQLFKLRFPKEKKP